MVNIDQKDDGYHLCEFCKGGGNIIVEEIKLVEVCEKCEGEGMFTWVENIFGKELKHSANHVQQHHNLQYLHHLLLNYGRRMGIEVRIEFFPEYMRQQESYQPMKYAVDYLDLINKK